MDWGILKIHLFHGNAWLGPTFNDLFHGFLILTDIIPLLEPSYIFPFSLPDSNIQEISFNPYLEQLYGITRKQCIQRYI